MKQWFAGCVAVAASSSGPTQLFQGSKRFNDPTSFWMKYRT